MKTIFYFTLIIFTSFKAYACSCGIAKVHNRYNSYDIVLKSKIIRVNENFLNEDYYRVDIKPIKTFKGKSISSVMVYGSAKGKHITNCGLKVFKGEVWLMYLYKDKEGNFVLHRCSQSRRVDKKFWGKWDKKSRQSYVKSLNLELKIVKFLKKNNKKYYSSTNAFSGELRKYINSKNEKGIINSNRFAFYELTLTPELKLVDIKVLQKFDNKTLSNEIYQVLVNEKKWILERGKKISKNETFLIGLFYYPTKERKGSISSYTL